MSSLVIFILGHIIATVLVFFIGYSAGKNNLIAKIFKKQVDKTRS